MVGYFEKEMNPKEKRTALRKRSIIKINVGDVDGNVGVRERC